MAFVAEDGTGIANANSLTSVEFADAYHADRGNEVWAGFELARKQQNLVKATDYLVAIYGSALYGVPTYSIQALPFPRTVGGVALAYPVGMQQAVAELALIADTTPLMPNQSRGKKRVKVGPLEVEYDGSAATQTQFIAASYRMVPFLVSYAGGGMARLVRS